MQNEVKSMKHRNRLALFCGILAVLLVVGVLASCGDSGNGTDSGGTGGTESGTGAATEPPDERTKLVAGGTSDWVFVYPSDASSVVLQAMNRMNDAIAKQTGVRLKTRSTSEKPAQDADAREILVGRTGYSETEAVLKTLMADQYAIRQVGNKIVLAALDDTYLLAAANYFVGTLLKANLEDGADGNIILYLQEYTLPSKEADSLMSINGTYINNFSIIYATDLPGYRAVAEQLQTLLQESTGYRLELYADTDRAEGTAELLIGKTNRTLSQTLYAAERVGLMTYEVRISGTALQILCGGPYSARECVSSMQFSMLGQEKLTFGDGSYIKTSLTQDTVPASSGSDVRIMTSNILAARWGEDSDSVNAKAIPPAEQRAEIYASVLSVYQPDAVGVQETDQKWLDCLPEYLDILREQYGLDYVWLFSTMDGKQNLTSMLYRADRLTAERSECSDYSFWNAAGYSYHLRVLAWTRFHLNSDPSKSFILLNTHWAHGVNNETPEQVAACVQEEIELVNRLKAEEQVPVFCTGDFNNRQDSENILSFREATGLRDSMLDAKENGTLVNYCGGCGNVGSTRTSDTYIDHIFGYGDYEVLKYETVLGNRVIWLSDHAPQYTDIRFNQ